MITILFVISHLAPQGPNKQLFYLCKGLNKLSFTPIVVTTSKFNIQNSLFSEFKALDIQIINLELGKLSSLIVGTYQIQEIIDKNLVNAVFSYGFRSDFICSTLENVVKVTSVRNTLLINWRHTWGPVLGTILGKINLFFIRKFDFVIACSQSVSNYLNTLNLNNIHQDY